MLNSVTIMGRIRKITRAEPGRAGQSRIYVEADVERDFVNADGARAADAVELVLYGKQADGFYAAEGDLAAFAGALRTRYAEPDASGRRAPITYIDVRRVYGTSAELPFDRQARAPGWNASCAGARELPAREADSRLIDRACPIGASAARSGAPSGESAELGALRVNSPTRAGLPSGEGTVEAELYALESAGTAPKRAGTTPTRVGLPLDEETVGAVLGASRVGTDSARAGWPSGEENVGAALGTSRTGTASACAGSPFGEATVGAALDTSRTGTTSARAGLPLGEENIGAEPNAPERAGHSTTRAETVPERASLPSGEEAVGAGPGTSRAGAAQAGATRPSPGGPTWRA